MSVDIGALSMESGREWRPLLKERYNELQPQISADGRWIVYTSDESGRPQVYVRPFPEVDSGGPWQVTTDGGDSPLWSRDGQELFYRNGDAIMVVSVKTAPTLSLETPKTLFRGAYVSSNLDISTIELDPWDISADGKRFLMMKSLGTPGESSAPVAHRRINIVLNWFEELKKKVPVK